MLPLGNMWLTMLSALEIVPEVERLELTKLLMPATSPVFQKKLFPARPVM